MINIITTIIKVVVGFKGGIWILIGLGILFVFFLIKNIFNGSFSIAKFFGGFNVFSGSGQGKLIYYFVIFSIVAAVALGIYHKFVQTTFTYDTSYKNDIHGNENVSISQNVNEPQKNYLIRLQLLGLDLHFWQRGSSKVTTKITNKNTPIKIDQSIPKVENKKGKK